jgi:NDP-sugar pyrophosphorylase family protein
MHSEIGVQALLDLDKTIAAGLFEGIGYPWQALPNIGAFILELGETLPPDEYDKPQEDVWISRRATVFASAYVAGPCIIDHGAEIRHGAFIRGNAIVGKGAVVGNSTELKNSVLFDGVQAPHYNYVGDSILGYKAHMGAGSITSNVKSDKTIVHVKGEGFDMDTGLRKFGAVLGDFVEIGCNSVLNPGTVIGRESSVYPISSVRGVVPERHIYKTPGKIVPKRGQ